MTTLKFERETCTRCGGSGHYSYCERYGTTCLKCAGKGEHLTKRAAAANKWARDMRTFPISEIKVGDKISQSPGQWFTVLSIGPGFPGKSLRDGKWIEIKAIKLTGKNYYYTSSVDSKVVRVLPQDVQRTLIEFAILYQNSLTKSGHPKSK